MSYILDALNRSNAESLQDPRALLASRPEPRRGLPVVPVLLGVLLLLNAGLGSWWLWQRGVADSESAGTSTPPAE